jgi:hypothetical protein
VFSFAAMGVLDFVQTEWAKAVSDRLVLWSSFTAAVMFLLSACVVRAYVQDRRVIAAAFAGAFAGTFLAMQR